MPEIKAMLLEEPFRWTSYWRAKGEDQSTVSLAKCDGLSSTMTPKVKTTINQENLYKH